MIPGLILLFLVAAIDWLAVAKGWKAVEYIAKPATMILLLGWLAFLGGFGSVPPICFGLGVFFSLAGDVFVMFSYYRFSNRWFVAGLAAFLLAHVSYIVGLNTPMLSVPLFWPLGLAIILTLATRYILSRIVAGIRRKGLKRLVVPVVVYGTVITLMLLSALLTFYRANWKTSAAGLVGAGAILFYLSDVVLAWNKFVTPIKNGRLANMILYHLGQFALVAGIVLQF